MNKRFVLKINGESPRSLFLAYVLAKLNCDIYLYDFLRISTSKNDYQLFLFSNSSKNLLSKFDIWKEIEEISYFLTSISIKDNLVSKQLLLRTEDFSKRFINSIGWTAKYSEIKDLLINKLTNYDNVHFIAKNQLIDKSLIFDYEFDFKNYDKIVKLLKFPISIFKRKDEQILIFYVYLRGHVEKRLYEINTNKGLLVLTPINKNLYQVVWNNVSFQIKESALNSKSLFLDNLSTLLPNEFKIDQINGDINLLHVNNIYKTYLIKNNSIYFNENKFKSNTIYDFNFDITRNLLRIHDLVKNSESKNFKILKNFGFYYFFKNYTEIIKNFSFLYCLLYLFKVNNIFSLILRKLLFFLLKRICLIKIPFIKSLNTSNLNN